MKILHLSAASEHTGAGKAALSTHNELLNQGIDSHILFLKSSINNHNTYSYYHVSFVNKLEQKTTSLLERMPLKIYPKRKKSIFSPAFIGISLRDLEVIKSCDVIHIHWANHGFIDLTEIKKWNKPVVWTLRDMWPFTGGCHYSFDCEGFKSSCGSCPALGSSSTYDLSYYVLKRKIKYIKNQDIKWVAISSWMKKQAKNSTLLKNAEISVIPSGVDGSVYALIDKEKARSLLKLPLNAIIILVGATSIREEYKGFEYVKSVLQGISHDVLVVTFGSTTFNTGDIPQKHVDYGNCNTDDLDQLYSAANLFLGPSIAEAMGKTFLEAQLNGLPVVCFKNTGPEDIIEHKKTGYLATFKDVQDLTIGLNYCLNNNFSTSYIRERALIKFDISVVCHSYIDLYNSCL
jgi:glycosyltransferase involved in cell wall biosynthesis